MRMYNVISQKAIDEHRKKCEAFTNRIMNAVYHERIKHGFNARPNVTTRIEIALGLQKFFCERSNGKKNYRRLER